MRMIVSVIISLVISALGTAAAVWFRRYYLDNATPSFAEILKKERWYCLVTFVIYLGVSIWILLSREAKGLTMPEAIQDILLWDGMFLVAVIDGKVKKIPNKLLLFLLLLRILCMAVSIVTAPDALLVILLSSLIGMAVGGGIILTMLLFSKGSVGAGDLKMFAILGLYFGLQGLIQTMIYTLFSAALFACVLLLLRKAKMRSTMPMAPFMLWGLTLYYILL